MFIAFEGIEQSGKSAISINFTKYLNSCRENDIVKIDPHFGDFVWTKEPSFSSEEAQALNNEIYIDENKRERIFFESRIRHQNQIAGKNIVCERYLWSGLAYAHKYSHSCFRFLKELYTSETLFIQPDLYIFVDTPPNVCCERNTSLDIDTQAEILDSYAFTRKYIRIPVINIKTIEDEKATLKSLIKSFEEYYRK